MYITLIVARIKESISFNSVPQKMKVTDDAASNHISDYPDQLGLRNLGLDRFYSIGCFFHIKRVIWVTFACSHPKNNKRLHLGLV